MATYTQILNKVIRRLREAEIASPTDSELSLLLGEFVNETKREVEDSWSWMQLRQTLQISTVDGTSQYSMTGAGSEFRLQESSGSIYNVTQDAYISLANSQWVKRQALTNTAKGQPTHCYFEGVDSNGDGYVTLYPTPDAAYTINLDIVVRQADLELGSDVLSVPEWPVVLGTYAKAIAERGEDNGSSHGEAMRKYSMALGDSISIDEAKTRGETTWLVS